MALESDLARRLRNAPPLEQLAIAAAHLNALIDTFCPESVQTIRTAVARVENVSSWLETLPPSPSTRYLRALLAADRGDSEAAEAWGTYLAHQPWHDPADLLAYARLLAGDRRFHEAEDQLRAALALHPDYAFFTRAEKLIGRVASESKTAMRSARIAILGKTTTGFFVPVLRALCLRDRIQAEFYEGSYGSQEQEILSLAGGLANFRPEIVVLPFSWRNPDTSHENLWQRLRDRFACHVVQFASDYPLVATLPDSQSRAIETINRNLWETAPGYVSILDTPAIQRTVGSRWEDTVQWFRYQQHPGTAALPALAEALMGHIRAVLGLTRKVLVTDLDNTLWKGVIGEDGLSGIQIGPGTPEGEAHQDLQRYLLDLKSRGILLAACSKNNLIDARLPFEKHEGMLLRLDDFAAFQANWEDKASNIRRIASDLSLGLSSFVFLDDSPIERAWVKSQIPEVTVIDPGGSIFDYRRHLQRGHFFDALSLTAEDTARAGLYQTAIDREAVRTSSDSIDDFLRQLVLQAWAEPIAAGNLQRVTQLVNKTNQFNTTSRRYNEARLSALAADPAGWASAFHLSDRFGGYGLIGAIVCKPVGESGIWEVDTWLMSCRVLGRQMEKFMFDRLIEAAVERKVRLIHGVLRPTAKNKLVETLFEDLGFVRTGDDAENRYYELVVPAQLIPTATHVEIRAG